jgi:hypothetical protein
MKAMLLGGRADRQNGGGTLRKAPGHLVPGQAFDKMLGGIAVHAPDFPNSSLSSLGRDTR